MSRGTCASIWDLVWIPLFVYSEAVVQVQRKASLRGGEKVCFGWNVPGWNVWEECSGRSASDKTEKGFAGEIWLLIGEFQ